MDQRCSSGSCPTRAGSRARRSTSPRAASIGTSPPTSRNKTAIIWEGELGEGRRERSQITYAELHREVVRCAGALAELGVEKGDRVAIYMGMVPEVAVAMLACARLGATHSVVFGGFAADALRDRINDCQAKVLITQDGAMRRGNVVPLKKMADKALEQTPDASRRCSCYRHLGAEQAPDHDEGRARRLVARRARQAPSDAG